MRDVIPAHLKSTWDLLVRTYPSGIPDTDYYAVLANLYPHMSDRNLAHVIAAFLNRDIGVITNDIYAVGAGSRATPQEMALVRERLANAGFEQWTREE